MSKNFEFFTGLLSKLVEGHDNDIYSISQSVQEISSRSESFDLLCDVLRSCQPVGIVRYGIICLKTWFINNFSAFHDRSYLFSTIFSIFFDLSSFQAQNDIINLLLKFYVCDEQIVCFQNHIEELLAFSPPRAISFELFEHFISYSSDLFEDKTRFIDFVKRSMVYSDEVSVFASCFGVNMCNVFEIIDIGSEIMSFLLQKLSETTNSLIIVKIINTILELSNQDCSFLDYDTFFEVSMGIIKNRVLLYDTRCSVLNSCTGILENCKEEFISIQNSQLLLLSVIELSAESFNEGDTLDLTPHQLYSICECFAFDNNIIDNFMNSFSFDTTFEKYVLSLFIMYTCEEAIDYYSENIGKIVPLLHSLMTEDCLSIRESSIRSIISISTSMQADFVIYSEPILMTFVEILKNDCSLDNMNLLKDILDSLDNSDCIFTDMMNIINELIESDDVNYYSISLGVLGSMIKSSEFKAQQLFEYIVQILFSSINNNKGEISILDNSIYCLAQISAKCSQQFEPYSNDFASVILDGIKSDHDSTQINSINALGYLLEHYPGIFISEAQAISETLFDLCSVPCDIDSLSITTSDISIRVLGRLFSVVPDMVFDSIEKIMAALKKSRPFHSAKASSFFISSIISCDDVSFISESIEMMYSFLYSLLEIYDKPTVGEVLTSFNECYRFLSINRMKEVIEMCVKSFKFELPCFHKENELNEHIHGNCQEIIRQAIHISDEIVKPYSNQLAISLIPLINHPISFFQNISLQLVGELMVFLDNQFICEYIPSFIDTVLEHCMKENYVGFCALKKIIEYHYEMIIVNLCNVYDIIQEKLSNSSKKTDQHQMMIDNCLSSLSSIALSPNTVDFPIEKFIDISLNHIPIVMDVEESDNVLKYFHYLYQNSKNYSSVSFLNIIISVFSTPVEDLMNQFVSIDTIDSLRKIAFQIFQSLENPIEYIQNRTKCPKIVLEGLELE